MDLFYLPEDILVTCILRRLSPIDYQNIAKTCKYAHLLCNKYIQEYINHIPVKQLVFSRTDTTIGNYTDDGRDNNQIADDIMQGSGTIYYLHLLLEPDVNCNNVYNSPFTVTGNIYNNICFPFENGELVTNTTTNVGNVVIKFHNYPVIVTILNDRYDTYIITANKAKLVKTDSQVDSDRQVSRHIKIYNDQGQIKYFITGRKMRANIDIHTRGYPSYCMDYNAGIITRSVTKYGGFVTKIQIVVNNLNNMTNEEIVNLCIDNK